MLQNPNPHELMNIYVIKCYKFTNSVGFWLGSKFEPNLKIAIYKPGRISQPKSNHKFLNPNPTTKYKGPLELYLLGGDIYM